MLPIRTTEVLAALSLTTDLALGVPFEEGLGVALVATALATAAGRDEDARRAVFDAALLHGLGVTASAADRATGGPSATEAVAGAREVRHALGPRFGASPEALATLDELNDADAGSGGRAGPAAGVVAVAQVAVRAHAVASREAAVAAVRRGAGGPFDPDVAAAFDSAADTVLAPLDGPDRLAAVVAAEPGPPVVVPAEHLDRFAVGLAMIVDLTGRYLLGHSAHVAALVDPAARLLGLSAPYRADVRAAALLHDLGRAAVPGSVWDRAGPLDIDEWEQVRLHAYWTERVLLRCPSLSHLAPLAGAHHERLDGSGYHRGARTIDQPAGARLIAAADAYAAMTEPRPYRPRLDDETAAHELSKEAARGRLDPDACAAVIEAAGFTRPRTTGPDGLDEREVRVLRLAARGWSATQLADDLMMTADAVDLQLARIRDRTGRRTRAGLAVFTMEHGLLPG